MLRSGARLARFPNLPEPRMNTMIRHGLAALATLLVGTAASPAWAESSITSSIMDSISNSVGSVSDSVKRSSKSSSGKDDVAAGDYRIIEVAEVADRPGTLGLKLQPVAEVAEAAGSAEDQAFWLYLPQPVVEKSRLAEGQTVTARPRPYGTEFAQGRPAQAFFLVLHDDWYRELQTKAVTL
jgi:hypothetical protein